MPHDPANNPKVLFAAGGTGGHLFPAQALAEKLTGVDVLFSGAKLSTNSYFDRNKFTYRDIDSTTPFRGNFMQKIQSVVILLRGIWQSLRLLSNERPDLVVGFGSFHSFPLLCAAALKRVPLVLFESNAVPGKVIRLFSRFALYTAVYFPESERYLKGKVHAVEIPSLKSRTSLNAQEARRQLGLDPDCFTLLVFGGSQGAKALNALILNLLPLLKSAQVP
ncbi:MAG: UDP-N-acetylglucosamine--N-acetylmuramyl-(pentapeptide) pyrophosphoryl-undecaprenol N-acetylglucosamine transferase [Chlamydiota bacterium]